ncbi:MAG: hypothetical protein DHS20C18_46010 [Saprospiraceae bacterium]|nr:MAG: hypothetical protein DHS20C18_46010 [Saprospiraceae bacterium]
MNEEQPSADSIVDTTAAKTEKEVGDVSQSSGKNFASDLQSFLEGAFEETMTEQLAEMPKNKKSRTKKRRRNALGGLDMLIRNTVTLDQKKINPGETTRRITFFIEQEKLEKLRSIAKEEKAYIKDVISSIVEEYLERNRSSQ